MKEDELYYKQEAESNPYLKMNHIEIDKIQRDYVRLCVTLRPELCNPYGMAHGGLLFTMSDCCAGINARTDGRNYVTLDADFHFLKNVRGGVLIAESRLIHRGKTTCLLRVTIHDEDGTVLTDGTFTMFCIDRKKEKPEE